MVIAACAHKQEDWAQDRAEAVRVAANRTLRSRHGSDGCLCVGKDYRRSEGCAHLRHAKEDRKHHVLDKPSRDSSIDESYGADDEGNHHDREHGQEPRLHPRLGMPRSKRLPPRVVVELEEIVPAGGEALHDGADLDWHSDEIELL